MPVGCVQHASRIEKACLHVREGRGKACCHALEAIYLYQGVVVPLRDVRAGAVGEGKPWHKILVLPDLFNHLRQLFLAKALSVHASFKLDGKGEGVILRCPGTCSLKLFHAADKGHEPIGCDKLPVLVCHLRHERHYVLYKACLAQDFNRLAHLKRQHVRKLHQISITSFSLCSITVSTSLMNLSVCDFDFDFELSFLIGLKYERNEMILSFFVISMGNLPL